jgi:hypothetical protein
MNPNAARRRPCEGAAVTSVLDCSSLIAKISASRRAHQVAHPRPRSKRRA